MKKIIFCYVMLVILVIGGCNKQRSLVEEGDILREQGKLDEAIAKYEQALKIDERSEYASMARTGKLLIMYKKAEMVENQGDLRTAFELYDQWLNANPEEEKNKAKTKIVSNAEQAAIKILSAQEINDLSVKKLIFLAEIILKYDQTAFKKAIWKAFIAFDKKNAQEFLDSYKEATEKKPNLLYEPYKFLLNFFDQKVMEMLSAEPSSREPEPVAPPLKKGSKKR